MKTTVSILSILLALFLVSCSGYRLDSGNYVMSLSMAEQQKAMPENVNVSIENGRITIVNPEKEGTLEGSIDGNRFIASGRVDRQQVEFTGNLVKDNTVEGKAIQKSDADEILFEANFKLVKAD